LPAPGVPWVDLIEETARQKAPALYHPDYANNKRREILELECVRLGTQFKEVPSSRRSFYRLMDHIVGASKGEETFYVYAEWAASGPVHGRPITRDELRKKGVSL
jgi:hypothetical protein